MDRRDTQHMAKSPRRRRVLVLIKCMGHGGAERLVVSMMRHRDRQRFDYEVAYVLEDRNTLVPQLRESGVAVHSLGARGNQDLRWMWRLRALLAEGHFDIVHSHLPYAATFGRLVAWTLSPHSALVYTDHGMWDKMALAVKALNRATIGLDDRLLVGVGGLPAVLAPVSATASAGDRARDRARADPRCHAPTKRAETSRALGAPRA